VDFGGGGSLRRQRILAMVLYAQLHETYVVGTDPGTELKTVAYEYVLTYDCASGDWTLAFVTFLRFCCRETLIAGQVKIYWGLLKSHCLGDGQEIPDECMATPLPGLGYLGCLFDACAGTSTMTIHDPCPAVVGLSFTMVTFSLFWSDDCMGSCVTDSEGCICDGGSWTVCIPGCTSTPIVVSEAA